MGSGSSVNSKNHRREEVNERKRMIKSVERFIINVYATCPRIDSMSLLLTSDTGKSAFIEFVTSERAEETIGLYDESLKLLALSNESVTKKPLTDTEFRQHFAIIVNKYIVSDSSISQVLLPATLFDKITKSLIDEKNETNNNDNNNNDNDNNNGNNNNNNSNIALQKIILKQILDECMLMMASIQLHRFITSKYFKKWRILEANHAIATTLSEMDIESTSPTTSQQIKTSHSNDEQSTSFRNLEKSMRRIISNNSKSEIYKKKNDLTIRAFNKVKYDALPNLLSLDSWLAILISAAEAIAISFALTSVQTTAGFMEFPIIYVNKYFEKVTFYSQSAVLGKNLLFFNCEESEQESLKILRNGMNQGQQVSAIMTVSKASNAVFRNLIMIKPVFSSKGKYIYTISTQIDVSKEVDGCISKQKLVFELINMLPNILYIDDDENDILYGCINI